MTSRRQPGFRRVVAAALLLFILCSHGTQAFAFLPSVFVPADGLPAGIDPIHIPEGLGTVAGLDPSRGLRTPLILQINDAHGNPEAQRKIEEIIGHLVNEHGFKTILAEGAGGRLDPALYTPFRERAENEKLWKELAGKGELTGVELYALRNPRREVTGVEDRSLYRKDLALYRRLRRSGSRAAHWLEGARADLQSRVQRILPAQAARFLRLWQAWKEEKTAPQDFLAAVKSYAEQYLDLRLGDARSQNRYPMLVRYFTAREQESRIDKEKMKRDREKLLRFLDRVRAPEASRKIAEIGFGHDAAGVQQPRTYFEQIHQTLSPAGFRFEDYPNLLPLWTSYILMAELEGPGMIAELEKISASVLSALAPSPEARALVEQSRDLVRLGLLLELNLTGPDYAVLRRHSNEKLKQILASLPGVKAAELGAIRKRAKACNDFYRLALIREARVAEHARAAMSLQKTDRAILVMGGFHSGGLEKRFERAGISYAQIVPRFEPSSDTRHLYLQALLERSQIAQELRLGAWTPAGNMEYRGRQVERALNAANIPLSLHGEFNESGLAARLAVKAEKGPGGWRLRESAPEGVRSETRGAVIEPEVYGEAVERLGKADSPYGGYGPQDFLHGFLLPNVRGLINEAESLGHNDIRRIGKVIDGAYIKDRAPPEAEKFLAEIQSGIEEVSGSEAEKKALAHAAAVFMQAEADILLLEREYRQNGIDYASSEPSADLAGLPAPSENAGSAYNFWQSRIAGRTAGEVVDLLYERPEMSGKVEDVERQMRSRRQFLHSLALEMRRRLGYEGSPATVFNPFGGINPDTSFAMIPEAKDAIHQGAEPFGSFGEIMDFYVKKHVPDIMAIEKISGFDSIDWMNAIMRALGIQGVGIIGLSRIIAQLRGHVSGLYYFRLLPDGTLQFLEPGDLSRSQDFPNALVTFTMTNPETGQEETKRWWYVNHIFERGGPPEFREFVNRLSVDVLYFKGAVGILRPDSDIPAEVIADDILKPVREHHPSALVFTDRTLEPSGGDTAAPEPVPVWNTGPWFPGPAVLYLDGGDFGYSYDGDPVYAGYARDLRDEASLSAAEQPGDQAEASGLVDRSYELYQSENFAEAEALLKKAIALQPSSGTWNKLGIVQARQKKLGIAADSYRRALSLDAKNADAWINYGLTLLFMNDLDEAENAYRTALDLDPENQLAGKTLIQLLIQTGRTAEAEAMAGRLLSGKPAVEKKPEPKPGPAEEDGDLKAQVEKERELLKQIGFDNENEAARIIEVLAADASLRPVFLVLLPEDAAGEIHTAGIAAESREWLRRIEAHSAFVAGGIEAAIEMKKRGHRILLGVTDRSSPHSLVPTPVANGRQSYFLLEDGTWLGVKGSGQNHYPDKPPYFVIKHDGVFRFRNLGLAWKAEAKNAEAAARMFADSDGAFVEYLGYREIYKAPDGQGGWIDISGEVNEDGEEQPVIIFSRVRYPQRMAKLPQMRLLDSSLTIPRFFLAPRNKHLPLRQWIVSTASRLGRAEALKLNNERYKFTIHPQDFTLAGEEADNEEFSNLADYFSYAAYTPANEMDSAWHEHFDILKSHGIALAGIKAKLVAIGAMSDDKELRFLGLHWFFTSYFGNLETAKLEHWTSPEVLNALGLEARLENFYPFDTVAGILASKKYIFSHIASLASAELRWRSEFRGESGLTGAGLELLSGTTEKGFSVRVRKQGGIFYLKIPGTATSGRAVYEGTLLSHLGTDPELRRFLPDSRLVRLSPQDADALNDLDLPVDAWIRPGMAVLMTPGLPGESLDSRLSRLEAEGGPDFQTALGEILGISEAVGKFHRKGVYNRDLKPQDIFVEPGGPRDGLKFLDFDLAVIPSAQGFGHEDLSPVFADAGNLYSGYGADPEVRDVTALIHIAADYASALRHSALSYTLMKLIDAGRDGSEEDAASILAGLPGSPAAGKPLEHFMTFLERLRQNPRFFDPSRRPLGPEEADALRLLSHKAEALAEDLGAGRKNELTRTLASSLREAVSLLPGNPAYEDLALFNRTLGIVARSLDEMIANYFLYGSALLGEDEAAMKLLGPAKRVSAAAEHFVNSTRTPEDEAVISSARTALFEIASALEEFQVRVEKRLGLARPVKKPRSGERTEYGDFDAWGKRRPVERSESIDVAGRRALKEPPVRPVRLYQNAVIPEEWMPGYRAALAGVSRLAGSPPQGLPDSFTAALTAALKERALTFAALSETTLAEIRKLRDDLHIAAQLMHETALNDLYLPSGKSVRQFGYDEKDLPVAQAVLDEAGRATDAGLWREPAYKSLEDFSSDIFEVVEAFNELITAVKDLQAEPAARSEARYETASVSGEEAWPGILRNEYAALLEREFGRNFPDFTAVAAQLCGGLADPAVLAYFGDSLYPYILAPGGKPGFKNQISAAAIAAAEAYAAIFMRAAPFREKPLTVVLDSTHPAAALLLRPSAVRAVLSLKIPMRILISYSGSYKETLEAEVIRDLNAEEKAGFSRLFEVRRSSLSDLAKAQAAEQAGVLVSSLGESAALDPAIPVTVAEMNSLDDSDAAALLIPVLYAAAGWGRFAAGEKTGTAAAGELRRTLEDLAVEIRSGGGRTAAWIRVEALREWIQSQLTRRLLETAA